MSSLLEEAIVDAKALKDAALKNAENAVLEKYSAEVRGALSTLLEQDEFGLDEGEEGAADTSFTDDVPFAFQNEELDAPADNELVEIDFDHLKARLEEEEAELGPVGGEELIDAEAMAADVAAPAPALAAPEVAAAPVALQEEITDTELEDDAEEDTASIATGKYVGQTVGPNESAEEDLDEDVDLTEEMLSDLIEELVVDMIPRPQGWASVNSADNSIEQANNDAMAAAQEAHLEEEEETEAVYTAPDVVSDAELFENKISELKESIKELYALLTESKDQLTKLNLENAKLVYQNKALSSASLNERQKTNIVESLANADTIEEAKVIFETLQSAVGGSSQKKKPKSLDEAIERKSSRLIYHNSEKKEISDPSVERMQRLAGIQKN